MRPEAFLVSVGAAACATVLVGALFRPADALAGWLAGAIVAASVPTGALVLMLMMRLIPGAWAEVLRLGCEAAALMAPIAALAFIPLLLGLAWLYPWTARTPPSAFAAEWLSLPGYALRLVAWLAWLGAASRAMIARRRTGMAAAAGLVAAPLLVHLVAVDWLMARDADFASSAFGLQALAIMVTIAFCAVLLLRRAVGARGLRPGVLGALLLTLLLIGVYLDFMAYLIVWSGNLPASVGWYAQREGLWTGVLICFAVLDGAPLLMLLFARFRRSPRWLAALAASVLTGRALELLWLAAPPRGLAAGLFGLLAIAGIGCLYAGLLPQALALRVRRRSP